MTLDNESLNLPRAGILVSGAGARDFLQGLITQDIDLLNLESMVYTALLNAHGRFLFDAFIWRMKDSYLIDVAPDPVRTDLMYHLNKYRLRAPVQINPIQIMVQASIDRPSQSHPDTLVAHDPRHDAMGWRTLRRPSAQAGAPDPTVAEPIDQAPGSDASAYHHRRMNLVIPEGPYDAEIGVSTPEELHLPRLNAVSFTKGCYLGQELTARMEHRGLGKRHVYKIRIADRSPLPPKADALGPSLPHKGGGESFTSTITLNDKQVGTLRSTCGDVGLALIRDDAVAGMNEIIIEPWNDGWRIIPSVIPCARAKPEHDTGSRK